MYMRACCTDSDSYNQSPLVAHLQRRVGYARHTRADQLHKNIAITDIA